MKKHAIKTPSTSGWFTVGIPLLLFLLLFIGLPILITALRGWNVPEWLGISLYVLGCLLGIGVNFAIYPLLVKIAQRGEGELALEGERLRWRRGRRWQEVDLNQPYWAEIAAGISGTGAETNASITLRPGRQMFHLRGAMPPEVMRQEVLRAFPEPYFVAEMAITPAEGLWGFNLQAEDTSQRAFFYDLLAALWRTRQNNEYYRLFRKFPWETPPRPAFTHIEVVDAREMSTEQRLFIERLESQVISAPTWTAKVTPDYLLGADVHRYYLMPLGYVVAEPGLGASSEAGNYLKVTGRDKDQRNLTVKLSDWMVVGDKEYDEGVFFVRFVNRRE